MAHLLKVRRKEDLFPVMNTVKAME